MLRSIVVLIAFSQVFLLFSHAGLSSSVSCRAYNVSLLALSQPIKFYCCSTQASAWKLDFFQVAYLFASLWQGLLSLFFFSCIRVAQFCTRFIDKNILALVLRIPVNVLSYLASDEFFRAQVYRVGSIQLLLLSYMFHTFVLLIRSSYVSILSYCYRWTFWKSVGTHRKCVCYYFFKNTLETSNDICY